MPYYKAYMIVAIFAAASLGQNYCTATNGNGDTLDFGPIRDAAAAPFTGTDSSGNTISFVRLTSESAARVCLLPLLPFC